MKIVLGLLLLLSMNVFAKTMIQTGAEQLDQYLPLLLNKRVGVFANHTSRVGKDHLINVLSQHHIHVVKIFASEHGFRGEQDAKIANSIDLKTHLPIVSLYGKKLKPTTEDLQDVDVIVFDIQDVGVRFYTYITSLQKMMEAAALNKKTLVLLDRPNPNGFYVDGPILDRKYASFTGMQPIPIVYGMTIGEYAKMIKGEEWLNLRPKSLAKDLKLIVIPCKYYSHTDLYEPPIKPSPNLSNIQAIYLYPSVGLMEATVISVGRGTPAPFQVFGHPSLNTDFYFVPTRTAHSVPSRYCYYNQPCYGWNLQKNKQDTLRMIDRKIQIKYLMAAYYSIPDKRNFFRGFVAMSGNNALESQIKSGLSEAEIRKSWQRPLDEFKRIRKKYLLYPDFE